MKNPNAAPGYVAMYPILCEVARAHGYALAIHGTVQRDLDLVAIPWMEEAAAPEMLVAALRKRCQLFLFAPDHPIMQPMEKPHGRRAWTIPLMGETFIDLSVMPRSTHE
jgi:hypothetical protein